MTAKQKANELGNKFYRGDIFTHGKEAHLLELEQARKYALICVDEILNTGIFATKDYWQEVRLEIEKL
ncbi:hypothetical protein AAIP58_000083 [Flavobacterium psychrophilum]|uniref:Uncharacterized protein n=1 Tax=Flavobacterium psychrophilum TaxID=96345 RepID=A0A7U2NEB8_FLAPS|nr:hypothetical protein [Flavobacterium psychrophilum]EKT4545840.1 hypothetical protein [Flavobacterium psychrophilum]QRE03532.1 hypothetical protein H0H26_11670 [Flavobacterium psychrophilum]